jgi:hypothetical protein
MTWYEGMPASAGGALDPPLEQAPRAIVNVRSAAEKPAEKTEEPGRMAWRTIAERLVRARLTMATTTR